MESDPDPQQDLCLRPLNDGGGTASVGPWQPEQADLIEVPGG